MYNTSLSKILNIREKAVLSIVGAGGKTSIMFLIAEENLHKKVLLTTSTKIFKPTDIDLILGDRNAFEYIEHRGVNILGNQDENPRKLKSLSFHTLDKIIQRYDISLIEADGSKGLPLKGWNEYEPVIYKNTTHTIGVITLNGLGETVSEENVHRVNYFIKNTCADLNSKVSIKDISKMVSGDFGMFKNSVGKRILIINQIEELEEFNNAQKLKKYILDDGIKIDLILSGSAKQKKWIELYRGDYE